MPFQAIYYNIRQKNYQHKRIDLKGKGLSLKKYSRM
jgi:hypothetical protein